MVDPVTARRRSSTRVWPAGCPPTAIMVYRRLGEGVVSTRDLIKFALKDREATSNALFRGAWSSVCAISPLHCHRDDFPVRHPGAQRFMLLQIVLILVTFCITNLLFDVPPEHCSASDRDSGFIRPGGRSVGPLAAPADTVFSSHSLPAIWRCEHGVHICPPSHCGRGPACRHPSRSSSPAECPASFLLRLEPRHPCYRRARVRRADHLPSCSLSRPGPIRR